MFGPEFTATHHREWGSHFKEKEPLRTKLALVGTITAGNLDFAAIVARRLSPKDRKASALEGVARLAFLKADTTLIRGAARTFGLTDEETKGAVGDAVKEQRRLGDTVVPQRLEAEFGLKT